MERYKFVTKGGSIFGTFAQMFIEHDEDGTFVQMFMSREGDVKAVVELFSKIDVDGSFRRGSARATKNSPGFRWLEMRMAPAVDLAPLFEYLEAVQVQTVKPR